MRRNLIWQAAVVAATTMLIASAGGCRQQKESTPALATQMDTISYCLGVVFGSNLPRDGFDTVDTKKLAQGLSDYVDRKAPLIDKDKAKQILLDYHAKTLIDRQLKKYADNKIDGEKFLEENGKRPEVTTLPSGLQYKVIKEGHGPKPGPDDLVLVHYQGKLIDGLVFEEHLTGRPIPFFVNRVIKGWQEALQMMPEGSRWMFYIPYQLGYGTEMSANGVIPPYSTLIFDLELVKVKKQK